MSNSINIVCAADDRFAMPLAMVIRSAAEKCSRPICAFVLSGDLSARSKHDIARVCRKLPRAPEIRWIDLGGDYMRNSPLGMARLSSAAFYRFAMGRVLPSDVRRALYLDSDVLVVHDLAPLWDTPLDGNIVGAIRDFFTPNAGRQNAMAFCVGQCALQASDPVFNSGVLLVDLDAYRAFDVEQKCIDFARRWADKNTWADQGALNAVLCNRWKPLDFRWNVQLSGTSAVKTFPDLSHQEKLWLEQLTPSILHFTGSCKPWNSGLKSPYCKQYVRDIASSGWFGTIEFMLWHVRWLRSCIGVAARNKIAGYRDKRRASAGAHA